MTDRINESIEKILSAIDNENEYGKLVEELKSANSISEIIRSIRAGYTGEYRYNFYLSYEEAEALIDDYIKRGKSKIDINPARLEKTDEEIIESVTRDMKDIDFTLEVDE